jgi:hypothetical protein
VNAALESFVSSIENFSGLANTRQNEYLVYFKTEIEGAGFATASQIDAMRDQLDLQPFRTAQDFSERSRRTGSRQAPFVKKHRGYGLERKLKEQIRSAVDTRPARKALERELEKILEAVPSGARRDYLVEALGCFQSNYLRAALLLTWCVAYDVLRDWLYTKHLAAINTKTQAWKKPLTIYRVEDFGEVADRTIVDLGRDIRALTKEEHKIIVGLLDRRNSYAHPTGRTISPAAVEAFIEESISEIVKKFS